MEELLTQESQIFKDTQSWDPYSEPLNLSKSSANCNHHLSNPHQISSSLQHQQLMTNSSLQQLKWMMHQQIMRRLCSLNGIRPFPQGISVGYILIIFILNSFDKV